MIASKHGTKESAIPPKLPVQINWPLVKYDKGYYPSNSSLAAPKMERL